MIEFVKIVLLSIMAAIVYGIVHDQVTARVCIEYFTIGHPRIFGDTESPTLLGIGWGIVATWRVGLLLGVPLAACCRVGGWRKLWARDLVRPMAVTLGVLFCLAMGMGLLGYMAANAGMVWLPDPLATEVPRERHPLFLADLGAHLTSYGFGALFGLGLCVWALRARARRSAVQRRAAQAGG